MVVISFVLTWWIINEREKQILQYFEHCWFKVKTRIHLITHYPMWFVQSPCGQLFSWIVIWEKLWGQKTLHITYFFPFKKFSWLYFKPKVWKQQPFPHNWSLSWYFMNYSRKRAPNFFHILVNLIIRSDWRASDQIFIGNDIFASSC